MANKGTHRRSTTRAGSLLLLVSVVLVGMAILAPAAQAAPGLAVTKTAAPVETDPVSPGETITYTVEISNPGDATATGVTVQDDTPADTTYVADSATGPGVPATTATNPFDGAPYSLPDLDAGLSHTITFQVTVDSGVADATLITNTATATSTNSTPASANDSTVHTVGSPTLTVTKTATPADATEVKPGDEITYSVDVANDAAATDTATNPLFTDATPADTSYVADSATDETGTAITGATNPFEAGYALPDMAPGDSFTLTFKVKVNSPVADATVITNTAKLSADNHAEVTDAVTHTVDSVAGLKVTASADPAPGTTVKAGATITYTAQVSNDATAGDTAKGVVYKDPTPEGTTYVDGSSTLDGAPVPDASNPFANGYSLGDMAPGTSHALSYKVTVNSGAGAINRTVTVTATNAAAAVTATTSHTGPGAGQLTERRGSGGRGGGGGGGGGLGSVGAGAVGSAGTEAAGSDLASTGLEDTTSLVLLATALFLVGLTLITRGRAVERRAAVRWDDARVGASRLMSRDPSARAWFFSDRR